MIKSAAILSIGDELITSAAIESNSVWLADQLEAHTVHTLERRVVGDDRAAIARAIRELATACDLLLLTGGLGPTPDDVTRAALGDVLTPNRPLATDPKALRHLDRFARARRGPMPKSNLVQALRPESMRMLANPLGTAMGLAGRHGGCLIFAMPGPPREMQRMFSRRVLPAVPLDPRKPVALTARVHAFGLSEAAAAERLGSLTVPAEDQRLGITVSRSIVTARIRAQGPRPEAEQRIQQIAAAVFDRWQPYAYGRDDESLPQAVGTLLAESGGTLATAESVTGGLLAALVVDAPGASRYYQGGWVTYGCELKSAALGVAPALLRAHGAVSEAVVCAMARGAMANSGCDYSLAITGVAGPTGDSGEKPVGTVFIGLGLKATSGCEVKPRRFRFPGDRGIIRDRAAKTALQMLRFALTDVDPATSLLGEA